MIKDSANHRAALDTIEWISPAGRQSSPAVPALLHEDLTLAAPMRAGVQYQNRLNRHSHYWFTPTRSHVWCESALETDVLVTLDFEGKLAKVVAQPMLMIFSDGSRHFPDFFGELLNGNKIVYDIKPSSRREAEDVRNQFANARRVCEAVGWEYQVLSEPHPTLLANLNLLRPSRKRQFHPEAEVMTRIQEVFDQDRQLSEGAHLVDAERPYLAHAYIRHLLWHRYLHTDLTKPLSDSLLVTTTRKGTTCLCQA